MRLLKNISSSRVLLRWGGKERSLVPGEAVSLEVAFSLEPKSALALESRFLSKFAGRLEVVEYQDEAPKVEEPVKLQAKPVAKKKPKKG